MIKKLRSRAALTLSEVLVAIAIMALVSAAVGSGMLIAGNAMRTINLSSEGAVLCDTLVTAISGELRYARNITTLGSGEIKFRNGNNLDGIIKTDANGMAVLETDTESYLLLGAGAYTGGLKATVAIGYSGGVFSVTVTTYTDDNPNWATATVAVRALNPV